MSIAAPSIRSREESLAGFPHDLSGPKPERPLVSVVVPVYNEAAVIEGNLTKLCRHMESLEALYRWEIVLVNDGSTDRTGDLLEHFVHHSSNVRIFHHITNFGLGQALRFAFRQCRGEYVITLDADLSCTPDHIQRLLAKITETRAKVIIASPYMEGGRVSNVPWLRRKLGVWANRLLATTAKGDLSTLTGVAHVFDARFLHSLNLRSRGLEVIPEIIYKAKLLGARIEEIPAHLDLALLHVAGQRRPNVGPWHYVMPVIVSGFLFRPAIFFILPGLVVFAFAAYLDGWLVVRFLHHLGELTQYPSFFEHVSAAVSAVYTGSPQIFILGISSFILSIQLIGFGLLALQNKNYFEEVFHLASTIYRSNNEAREYGNHPDQPKR